MQEEGSQGLLGTFHSELPCKHPITRLKMLDMFSGEGGEMIWGGLVVWGLISRSFAQERYCTAMYLHEILGGPFFERGKLPKFKTFEQSQEISSNPGNAHNQ